MVLVEKSAQALALRCEMQRQRLLDCLEPDPFRSPQGSLRLVRVACAAAGKILVDAAELGISPFHPEVTLGRTWLLLALKRIEGEFGEYCTDKEHGYLVPLGFPDVLFVLEESPPIEAREDYLRYLAYDENRTPASGIDGYTVEEFMLRHVALESVRWLPGVTAGDLATTEVTFVSRDGYPLKLLLERQRPHPINQYVEILAETVEEILASMQRLLEQAVHRGEGGCDRPRAGGVIDPREIHVIWNQSTEMVQVRVAWESVPRKARSGGPARAVLKDLVRAANTAIDRHGRELAEGIRTAEEVGEPRVIDGSADDVRRDPKVRELLRSEGLPPGMIKLALRTMEMKRFRDFLLLELGDGRVPPASSLFPIAKCDELDEVVQSQRGAAEGDSSAGITNRGVAFHFGYVTGT